jgi:hypothetical protein
MGSIVAQCRGCGGLVGYDLGSMWAKERGLCADCRARQSRAELVATTKDAGSGLTKVVLAGTPLLLIVLALAGTIAWYWGLLGGLIVFAWGKAKKT